DKAVNGSFITFNVGPTLRISSVHRFHLCCALSGWRFAAVSLLPAGPPRRVSFRGRARKSRIIQQPTGTVYNIYHMDRREPGDEHGHRHGSGETAASSLKAALLISTTFLVAEFFGALYTNSLALLADAGHMLTDVAALSLSLFAIRFASRRATPRKTYGFYRVEILAALLNGVFLVLVALYIFYEANHRLLNPRAVKGNWMLVVAVVGLFANITSAYILFGKHHESLNVRGAFFHVLSDGIGSVGAILASIAILVSGYQIADPSISMLVAV